MKANTPELMKFKRLQRRLGLSVAQLVGHLELLWISTAKNAPEGDIGRFTNEEIAIGCYWEADPDEFVDALVECGWLDESEEWRLLVHDWAQHAPTYVHGGLKRHGRSFRTTTSQAPKEPPKEPPKESPIGTSSEDTPTKPIQVKPSQAFSVAEGGVEIPEKLRTERFYKALKRWFDVIKVKSYTKQVDYPAIQVVVETLALNHSERKSVGYVLAWAGTGRVLADFQRTDWEEFAPRDEAPPPPKRERLPSRSEQRKAKEAAQNV